MPWREQLAGATPPHYGAWAAAYDRFRPHYPADVIEVLMAAVGAPARRCLELGAGTGQITFDLLERFDEVVAVEPDRDMAARIAPAAGLSVCIDPAEVAELKGIFDAVVAATSLHWMDVPVVLERARGWLRPGGVIFACTFCTGRYPGAGANLLDVISTYSKQLQPHTHERLRAWHSTERLLAHAPGFTPPVPFEHYLTVRWSPDELAGFLLTVSSGQAFAQSTGEPEDVLARLTRDLSAASGGADISVRFPVEGAWARRL